MPVHEYKCEDEHVSEVFFKTFSEAEGVDETVCLTCGKIAVQIWSVPGQAILYGEGFHKPAASGRTSTRTHDMTKTMKEFEQATGGGGLKGLIGGNKK